jgi:hypothetical protein
MNSIDILKAKLAKQGITPKPEKVKEKKDKLTDKRIKELTIEMLTDLGYIE